MSHDQIMRVERSAIYDATVTTEHPQSSITNGLENELKQSQPTVPEETVGTPGHREFSHCPQPIQLKLLLNI